MRIANYARTCVMAVAVSTITASLGGCTPSVDYNLVGEHAVGDPRFARVMGDLFGHAFVGGTQITTLRNGVETYPEMLEAIRAAKHTVTFETYMFGAGPVADIFTQAFVERAREGVKVHVILDPVGSFHAEPANYERMREAGVELVEFHAARWWHPMFLVRFNERTHRKLLIVDGRVGFIGGAGIDEPWRGDARDAREWRDTHYRVEGPVVAQLQAVFMDHWGKLTGRVPTGDVYFPRIDPVGAIGAQVIASPAGGNGRDLRLAFLMAIAAARERICLATAYFVPDDAMIRHIAEAARRGVRVQIIVPGRHTDSQLSRQASRAAWGKMLEAGVEIYEFQPTMYHTKLMVVDETWVTIGSANFDNRSFRVNAEAIMNVVDPPFAREQVRHFEEDLSRSVRVTHEHWSRRPFWEKCFDAISTICSPHL